MAWFVTTMQNKEGFWTRCAESDEGGGFLEGCQCRHSTEAAASACLLAEIALGSGTGFQVDDLNLAQVAYEAYCAQANWMSIVTGAPLPQWDGLGLATRAGWLASARSVRVAMAALMGKLIDRVKAEVGA